MGQGDSESRVRPISPAEAAKLSQEEHEASIPEVIIDAFNELIKKNWRKSTFSATVGQTEVLNLAIAKSKLPLTRAQIFDNNWLDVEDLFRKAGWEVTYDKPAYCETYEPTFKFEWTEKKDDRIRGPW